MLNFLHIENIAVIERADIDLSAGFNVLTGETGAGKSIMIDAIHAVLGERTSKELIRSGSDRAEVSAVFSGLSDDAVAFLSAQGISPDADGNLVLRRVLSLTGSNSARINGTPVSVSVLRSLARYLVDIHGQHDNQNLLDPQRHCEYVDLIADNSQLRQEYYEEFRRLNAIRKELSSLETDEDEKQRRIDLLTFQINEIESAALTVGETDVLRKKLTVAENYEKTVTALKNAYFALNGDDRTDGAITGLYTAEKLLSGLAVDEFSEASQKLSAILNELDGIAADIRSFTENEEYSAVNGDELRTRLDFIRRLMLKYGNSEEEILGFAEKARKELHDITFSDQRTAELSDELDRSTERLVAFGERLTRSRKAAADDFCKKVTASLAALDMKHTVFLAEIKKGRYTKNGCDELQFLLSANAGEDPKPLSRIASGGELSRVMLSIKSTLAGRDTVGTMIFDEIDSGISGHAALRVAEQIRRVSRSHQVLCVTHLAQIAAVADRHLMIEKYTRGGKTYTEVTPLDYEGRISEVARIMAGTDMTESLYSSAKELIDRSSQNADL